MKLVPLGDKIVLKQVEAEETTKGGIILAAKAQERPQQATVIAVGDGKIDGKEIENVKCLFGVCANAPWYGGGYKSAPNAVPNDGKLDYKLISVVDCDPRYADVQKLEDLSPFVLKEIANFFSNYKVLQGITVKVGEFYGKEDALRVISECRTAYQNS